MLLHTSCAQHLFIRQAEQTYLFSAIKKAITNISLKIYLKHFQHPTCPRMFLNVLMNIFCIQTHGQRPYFVIIIIQKS